MARYHVRCRACQARRVLRMTPDEYYRLPKCNNCGAQDYRLDRWMNRRDAKAIACDCAGYVVMTHRAPWPHRIGSPYCWFRKDGIQRMPGDADFKDFSMEQEQCPNLPIAA